MLITQILIDAYIFSVVPVRSHALAPILIPAILAMEHANVIQVKRRQHALELHHTALTQLTKVPKK